MADTVNILLIAVGLILIAAYIGVYIAYRQYLREPFDSKPEDTKPEDTKPEDTKPEEQMKKAKSVVAEFMGRDIEPDPQPDLNGSEGEMKFTFGNPIQSVDDYEYNYIFQNESDRELTEELRNKLISQYPMHFSVLPPSAPQFVSNTTEGFQDASGNAYSSSVDTQTRDNPYNAISNSSVAPPDTLTAEQQERSLLKPYAPKKAGDLTTYNVEDAMDVIKKIYDKKGEIPDVKKRENNVYEIVGSRRKDEKIVYEDTDTDSPTVNANATIKVPSVVNDLSSSRDPFYEMKDRNTKQDRWDYRQWTPGLERMFAPTEPRANWY